MSAAGLAMDRMYRRQRHVYDLTRKFYLLGRDELIETLQPPKGGTVLEIACGTGRNLIRAADIYPEARFFGLDVSAQMLATARARGARMELAQADACAFDPQALFGEPAFDRVFISYALSMIPDWRAVCDAAARLLAPGGTFGIVDFGDAGGLPPFFRQGLHAWLAKFDVTPRLALEGELRALAQTRGLTLTFQPLYRRYAYLATLQA